MAQKIGVLGSGAWGTALAIQATRAGNQVVLVGRSSEQMARIQARRENDSHLPGVTLPDPIEVTADRSRLFDCSVVLSVVPAQHTRSNLAGLAEQWPMDLPIVLCSKGIEQATGALMNEAAMDALPGRPVVVLSGPTFAKEVAAGLPSAVTLAAENTDLAHRLADLIGTPHFRPYISDDVVGVEVAGAVKNVLAIASGIVTGLALGHNARAALITRGLAEIARLAAALGGKPETLLGLAGVGDVALTCTASLSRNYSFGLELGKGRSTAEILAERNAVTEGVYTATSVLALADRYGVEMPICHAVNAVANHGADLKTTLDGLLSRPLRRE